MNANQPDWQSLKIADEKRKYILDILNPVLEELVAQCIHKTPKDPVPFMLEWLENKKLTDADRSLAPEEKERIAKENEALEQEIKKVKSHMQDAAKLASENGGAPDEEEEEEDEEPPEDFFKNPGTTKCRQSVSAEAYGDWNQKKAFVAPVIMKSDEAKDRLKKVLTKSFLFSTLEEQDLIVVIGAMKEVVAEPGDDVIVQGDTGDFLFVIESGQLDCMIGDKVVKTCEVGDVFGELALLYNCPRAATVRAKDRCILWQLDRDTFNTLVKEAAQKKRARYDNFLQKVPLLQAMDAYERSQLADALVVQNIKDKEVIVNAGDQGNTFFIIEEGLAKAVKDGNKVMDYKSGDYFGELALLRNQPRAATVVADGPVKLLGLDSGSFKRLLKVEELLDRTTQYA